MLNKWHHPWSGIHLKIRFILVQGGATAKWHPSGIDVPMEMLSSKNLFFEQLGFFPDQFSWSLILWFFQNKRLTISIQLIPERFQFDQSSLHSHDSEMGHILCNLPQ